MELSWSTFILEMINFLVLIWILKRFLYKPVMDVISRRQAGIEKTLADARSLQDNAAKLQQQYESRLAAWEKERQLARDKLALEMESERAAKIDALQNELLQEREKARVADASRLADARRNIELTAFELAAQFATRLLSMSASIETEARLVELVISELSALPAERIAALRHHYGKSPGEIRIASAFVLAQDQRLQLEQALLKLTALDVPVIFEENTDLLAGVLITVGAWVLGSNLRDELKGMAELAHAG